MDFAVGFAVGFAMAKKMFEGGGSSYVNNDPDYALYKALPEPAANQAVILIRIADTTQQNYISVHYYPEISSEDISEGGEGTVDWGDGTSEGIGTKWSGGVHAYPTPGDYIITVTDNSGGKIESVCCYKRYRYGYPIAMKVGASFVYDDGLGGKYIDQASDFKYIQFSSDYIWNNGIIIYSSPKLTRIDFMGGTKPDKLLDNQFRGCNALDFDNLLPLFSDVTEIGNYTFNSCYNLKKISLLKCTKVGNNSIYQCSGLTHVDLPLCTEIGSYAVAYNYALREVNMPLCASVGNNGLTYNYALNKATLPDSCNYGSGAFKYSNCLIPTPNGIYPY